jgi:signal transduction histidine kinase
VKSALPNASIKLSHQGVLLVSVPLVCQIVFILVLTMLLGQVEREAYKAEHSRNILLAADRLVALFYQAGTALATYDVSKNPLFRMSYEASADKAVNQLMLLRHLAQGDAEAEKSMDSIDLTAADMLSTLAVVEGRIDRGENPMKGDAIGRIQSLQSTGDNFSMRLAELTSAQKAINAAEPAQELRLRAQVEYCLLAGVVLNILLALGLARAFYRTTASRLNILMQNTQRLVLHQQLHPQISGTDEIAQLDTFFRQMAAALEDAARHKQQFLQMVSHDLRSPLTAAQLSLGLMTGGSKGALPDQANNELVSVQNSLGRLVHLINDLLDIEKLESGGMELRKRPVNLEVIIGNCIETVKPLADSKELTLDHHSNTDIDVIADGERMSQVLINLLSNAIKMSPDKTIISISAEFKAEDMVQIDIKDQGPGIEEEYRSAIFDRFKQTPNSKGGSGLGLAICKAIVEQHGGKIGVVSDIGKGSTFWFQLPSGDSASSSDSRDVLPTKVQTDELSPNGVTSSKSSIDAS